MCKAFLYGQGKDVETGVALSWISYANFAAPRAARGQAGPDAVKAAEMCVSRSTSDCRAGSETTLQVELADCNFLLSRLQTRTQTRKTRDLSKFKFASATVPCDGVLRHSQAQR